MHPYRSSTSREPKPPFCTLCSDTGVVQVTVVSAPRITPYPVEVYRCSCGADAVHKLAEIFEGYKHEEEWFRRHGRALMMVFASALWTAAFHFGWFQ